MKVAARVLGSNLLDAAERGGGVMAAYRYEFNVDESHGGGYVAYLGEPAVDSPLRGWAARLRNWLGKRYWRITMQLET